MAKSEEGAGMSFAERMMKNMGWSQGKGLGKQEEGMKDFIKPKMKFNTKGIGFMGVDNKWIAHQEHFDDLLTSLNKGEKPAEKKDIACLTSASKLRGRTKFYAKMMRGKDLSNRSSRDLSSIILPLSKKDEVEKPETAALPSELHGSLKSSQVSMDDYFAQIMAQRKAKVDDEESSTPEAKSPDCSDETDDRCDEHTECRGEPTGKKKHKKRKQVEILKDSSPSRDAAEPVVEISGVKSKKKRNNADHVEPCVSLVADFEAADSARPDDEQESIYPHPREQKEKKKKKKSKIAQVTEVEDPDEAKPEKKVRKSKKRKEMQEVPIEDVRDDSHKNIASPKRKKNKTEGIETAVIAETDRDGGKRLKRTEEPENNELKQTKYKKYKHDEIGKELEISEDGTRLNVDVELLKKIRGPKLAKSKAAPVRNLTDDQIKQVYDLWLSGQYGEFMRRVHSGELPRWVACEESLVDRMMSGKTKLIDLEGVRQVVQAKWKNANVDEIWGYSNVAYLAV